jgi:hypothetical protein
MDENITRNPAGTKGVGTFAVRDIESGELVYSFPRGRFVVGKDLASVAEADKKWVDKIGPDTYEIIEPPARYLNHSCDPNILETDRVGYALRDIKAGEEITVDYEAIKYVGPAFECCCRSRNCRKRIPSQ